MWYPVAESKTNMDTVVSQCGTLKRTRRKLSKLDPCPRSSRANSTASASALLAPISPCAFGDSAQYLCNHPSWAHTSTHTAHNNHATTLLGTHAHTHSEPTSCSAGRPSRRSSCTYLSPSLSVHECFQLRLQHHHSALRFEFHVQVLHPMLDYRQTFNCAPAWPSGPSSPFRPRRCRVASPAPYGRHPSPMSPSPMAESKTNMATVLNASWEWLGGRRRGRGRGRISRVGVRADSRPLLFFSSGAACCRHLAPSCHRIIHDIGIILQFWRCMLKAACVAVDGLKDEVLVSTMLRYITQTMVAP